MGASAMAGLRAYVFWVMLCLAVFSMDSDQAKQEEKSFSEFVSDEKNSPPWYRSSWTKSCLRNILQQSR